MRSNTSNTRQLTLAVATTVAMAMTTIPGMASGMTSEQSVSSKCENQWFMSKSRILERQAASLLHSQSRALLDADVDGSASLASLKEVIADQDDRTRFAVEALMRSRNAPQNWYGQVSDIAKTYAAMSEIAARTAELLEAGDADGAYALYRTESVGLYEEIMKANYALSSDIDESMSIKSEMVDVAN